MYFLGSIFFIAKIKIIFVLLSLQAPGSAAGPNGIYLYPQGLRDALVYISKGYGNPKIYITENGKKKKFAV